MRRVVMLAMVGTLACVPRPIPGRGAERAATPVEITIARPPGERWVVRYRLAAPAQALHFRRPYQFRGARWRIDAEPSGALERFDGGEGSRRADGRPIDALVVEVETHGDLPDKDYRMFLPFSDGGVLVYTGHFDVVPLACPGQGPSKRAA